MRLGDADLDGQPRPTQRVLSRGAGAAVVPRERDDVRARLRDTDGDDADVGDDRHLHGDTRPRVHRLELVHHLREVLDRVDVVIVRWRDEVDAWLGVARERDLPRQLARGQMYAFAGLGALTDLDLEIVGRIREHRRQAKTPRHHLLPPLTRIHLDYLV